MAHHICSYMKHSTSDKTKKKLNITKRKKVKNPRYKDYVYHNHKTKNR